MKSNCLLSIIVVALNEEKRLPLLLKSISNEADNDIEVILINNGSTDNTYRIMQEYTRSQKPEERENSSNSRTTWSCVERSPENG